MGRRRDSSCSVALLDADRLRATHADVPVASPTRNPTAQPGTVSAPTLTVPAPAPRTANPPPVGRPTVLAQCFASLQRLSLRSGATMPSWVVSAMNLFSSKSISSIERIIPTPRCEGLSLSDFLYLR